MALILSNTNPTGRTSEQELNEVSVLISHMHDLLDPGEVTYLREATQTAIPHTWLIRFDGNVTRLVRVTIDSEEPPTLEWV